MFSFNEMAKRNEIDADVCGKCEDASMGLQETNKLLETDPLPNVKTNTCMTVNDSTIEDVNAAISNCMIHIRILYGIILSLALVIIAGASILQRELRNSVQYHEPAVVSFENGSVLDDIIYSLNNPHFRKLYGELYRTRRQVGFMFLCLHLQCRINVLKFRAILVIKSRREYTKALHKA